MTGIALVAGCTGRAGRGGFGSGLGGASSADNNAVATTTARTQIRGRNIRFSPRWRDVRQPPECILRRHLHHHNTTATGCRPVNLPRRTTIHDRPRRSRQPRRPPPHPGGIGRPHLHRSPLQHRSKTVADVDPPPRTIRKATASDSRGSATAAKSSAAEVTPTPSTTTSASSPRDSNRRIAFSPQTARCCCTSTTARFTTPRSFSTTSSDARPSLTRSSGRTTTAVAASRAGRPSTTPSSGTPAIRRTTSSTTTRSTASPTWLPSLSGMRRAARGKTPTDVWWHTIVSPTGKEKTGYPTQKPLGILERIVRVHFQAGRPCARLLRRQRDDGRSGGPAWSRRHTDRLTSRSAPSDGATTRPPRCGETRRRPGRRLDRCEGITICDRSLRGCGPNRPTSDSVAPPENPRLPRPDWSITGM